MAEAIVGQSLAMDLVRGKAEMGSLGYSVISFVIRFTIHYSFQ